MLGVVHCKCGQKYADQSGLTTVELCEAAKGMKHPSGVTTSYKDGASRDAAKNDAEAAMVGRMRAHLKNSPAFRTRLAVAERKVSASLKDSSDGASYPPGACAAQKVLVLLLDDRAVPAAMTERWYGSETGSPIAYLEVSGTGRKRTRNRVVRKFKNGETVPPCGTCELLVPLLTCAQERPTCKHRT
ncbi:hypothetical protein [Nannocystis pusilla]|uniref:hypothetical protein n=1 Tax=Nannocystis pusilla TaxID=889268 RepID=UPI003B7ACDC7